MANIYDILLDFWEASIHNILFAQKIYPDSLYEKRLLYGARIYQCRHPDVNSYIRNVLVQTRSLLEHGLVQQLVYAVSPDHDSLPYHQISFDCLLSNRSGVNKLEKEQGMDVIRDLEEQFRNTLISIMNMPSPLQVIQDTDVWSLMVLTDNSDGEMNGVCDEFVDSKSRAEILRKVLHSGSWTTQNHLLVENRASTDSNMHVDIEGEARNGGNGEDNKNEKEAVGTGRGKTVLRRFQNEVISMSVSLVNF